MILLDGKKTSQEIQSNLKQRIDILIKNKHTINLIIHSF